MRIIYYRHLANVHFHCLDTQGNDTFNCDSKVIQDRLAKHSLTDECLCSRVMQVEMKDNVRQMGSRMC